MDNQTKTDEQRENHEREPYEPPAIVAEEVFEVMALACGKLSTAACIASGNLRS
jgi:hypothetical protein